MGLRGRDDRPALDSPTTAEQAYDDTAPADQSGNPAGSQFEQEYLFFLSEMDSEIHDLVEQQGVQAVDDSGRLGYYFPNYWFINGRNAPDTMAEAGVARLPTQPYGALAADAPRRPRADARGRRRPRHAPVPPPRPARPGHRGGRRSRSRRARRPRSHAVRPVARGLHDPVAAGADGGRDPPLDRQGARLGHLRAQGRRRQHVHARSGPEGLDPTTHEYCADHRKPLPVVLPEALALTNGPVLQRQSVPRARWA